LSKKIYIEIPVQRHGLGSWQWHAMPSWGHHGHLSRTSIILKCCGWSGVKIADHLWIGNTGTCDWYNGNHQTGICIWRCTDMRNLNEIQDPSRVLLTARRPFITFNSRSLFFSLNSSIAGLVRHGSRFLHSTLTQIMWEKKKELRISKLKPRMTNARRAYVFLSPFKLHKGCRSVGTTKAVRWTSNPTEFAILQRVKNGTVK